MELREAPLGQGIEGQVLETVRTLIERHGGVAGIVKHMEQVGFGSAVRSWVSQRANLPVDADEVAHAFGSASILEFATKIGLAPQDLAQRLARALPATINQLTPAGVVKAIS